MVPALHGFRPNGSIHRTGLELEVSHIPAANAVLMMNFLECRGAMQETSELTSLLRKALSSEKLLASRHIVLYASFGVVKGRTTSAFARRADDDSQDPSSEILELIEVTVEHYSSHLPTASFDQLYVQLSDIRAFAFGTSNGKS